MPRDTRRVGATGPSPASILLIGEGPGKVEAMKGRPFVGPSGAVLWAMARDYAGIERKDVRVTNLSPYRLTDDKGKDRPPTEDEAEEFAPALREEIKRCDPELIVTLGKHSTSVVLRRPVEMAVVHGGQFHTRTGRVVIPVVHPAAGLYEPSMLARTAEGLHQVGFWKAWGHTERGEVKDEFLEPDYYQPVLAAWRPIALTSPCAIDTEGRPGDRWSLQWSCAGGQGRMIRADNPMGREAFRKGLERYRPELIFHNALWDIPALLEMGIDIIAMGLKWRDTMIESYISQKHPHGLKPLAERLCGMEMDSYESIVGPVVEAFARDYITRAYEDPPVDWAFAEGRKHSIIRRLGDLLNPKPSRATVSEPKGIHEKWFGENFDATRATVEATCGPMPEPGLDDIPADQFLRYACRDPDATLRVAPHLSREIDEAGLARVRAVDTGALPLILRMQRAGMLVDTHRLDELREFVSAELAATTETIRILTGIEDFNPASGDQVAAYCKAQGLGLEKLTKSGKREQVDENALTLIRFKDPAIEPLLYHRELSKLLGTYIIPLYGFLVGKGRYRRLYGNFRLTSAITGRLSMNDPNLMAFPTRTELGRRVRACFVASEGHRIGSVDLSQIELRVGAGLSQDEEMMRAFVAGEDLHTRTASKLFDVPPEKVDPLTQRYPCKTANFAIFYGARAHRLEAEFLKAGIPGYDNARCEEFVASWFALYSGVGAWIADTYRFGRENGYVTTDAGRRRYLPALRFDQQGYPFNCLREEAQRQASNFPVQGTAQEVIKLAMPVIEKEVLPVMADLGYFCEPLLQIHDEVLLETAEEGEEVLKELCLEAMTRQSPWKGVPLAASWASGEDWASAK